MATRKNPNCINCGSVNPAGKSLCSPACKLEHTRRKQGFKGVKRPAVPVPCAQCGCMMKARSSNGKAGRSKYCSHECLWQSQRNERDAIQRAEASRLAIVRPEVEALKRMARYIERPSIWLDGCVCCSKSMIVRFTKGGRKRVCDACTIAAKVKSKRIGKGVRRAREKGVGHEALDPIKVFERDGWQCYLCKRNTPKELRGTYDPLAPELEHVIPLSKGGSHTWANVACACRECNQAKGSKVNVA